MLTCGLFLTNFSLAIFFSPAISQLSAYVATRLPRSGSLGPGGELLADSAGYLGVVGKLHGVRGSTSGARSQVRRIAEHGGQRNQTGDDLYTTPRFDSSDLSPSRAQIAHDVAEELIGGDHLDGHQGLE